MRRSVILVIACLAALAAMSGRAFAAGNGMLAAVAADGKLVTLNPDGSGVRTLWTPPASTTITALTWSPEGKKLALIAGGKLVVWDVVNGTSKSLPNDGDSEPTWSSDGTNIGFKRGSQGMVVSADLENLRTEETGLAAETFAWAPNLSEYAFTIGGFLYWSGMKLFPLAVDLAGAPAWSADSNAVAFVSNGPQPGETSPGLYTRSPIGNNAATKFVVGLPASAPRWSPDSQLLLYLAGTEWRTVSKDGGAPSPVSALSGMALADWQPCVLGVTQSCTSVAPPVCAASPSVTTQAGQPVDIPEPCRDPVSRGLSYVVSRAPEHGSLAGQRYTPAPGFVGQDAVTYKVSNGVGDAEVVTVKIFVVPRPAPAASPTPTPKPVVVRAPFLTARATPKLDRKRTTLVRLACDQNCSFDVRLTAELKKPKKTLRGSTAKRTLVANRELSLRLRLPTKPKGKLKTVWITGIVRSTTGESRSVKLPVRLPR